MKQLTIFKIGGKVIGDDEKRKQFLENFAKYEGHKILVHGGGKKASELSKKLEIVPNMKDGRRITDAATLEVVTMVYAGLINKKIVSELQAINCNALGLSGADANLIQSQKRPVKTIDYGFVGDIEKINTSALSVLLDNGFIPVFCAITDDKNGQLLNTNADTIAAELSKAMAKIFQVDLMLCFEQKGVLLDINKPSSVIQNMDFNLFKKYEKEGIISEGMLPKLGNGFAALDQGVKVKIGSSLNIFETPFSGTSLQ